MVYHTNPQNARRPEAQQRHRTSAGLGGFLLLVLIVAVAVFGYHIWRNDAASGDANRSTIERPVVSPQDSDASPIHPYPSPNPGP